MAAHEWIQKNSILPINRIQTNLLNGVLETEKSSLEGDIRLPDGRLHAKQLAVDFVIKIDTPNSLSVKTHCVNIFTCKPTEVELQDSLIAYIESRAPIMREEKERSRIQASDKARSDYLAAFNGIKSYFDALAFVKIYKDSDPDNLIPKAEVLLVELRAENAARAKAEAEAKEQDRIKHAEINEIAKQKRASENKNFRSRITLGDESHCGMVIELKTPLVKIQTMSGEKWFRIEQIYPRGLAPCNFYNNVYQDIGSTYGFD